MPTHVRVVCGTCEADWEAVLAHAASDPKVIPMLGLHPWYVEDALPRWASRLDALLRAHQAGVGECGLDFARKATDHAEQEAAFRVQLRLAHAHHRPIAMHVVRAWGRTLEMLCEEGVPQTGAMVHAFTGSPETARALQTLGVFLSFSSDLLDPARLKVRASLRAVGIDHLLLETDGHADLLDVISAAADILEVPAENLAARTWENGQRCFKGWQA